MKKQALKITLIATIILSGCTTKKNLISENNIYYLNNSNNSITFSPIPINCIDGFKSIKVLLKQEKELGNFMNVSVCKINDSSIKFRQINTIENFNSEILFNNEHYEILPYYNCNTEEAKKEKYKRVSICKKDDGFSELVVLNQNI